MKFRGQVDYRLTCVENVSASSPLSSGFITLEA